MSALKVPTKLDIPIWDNDVMLVINRHWEVFAKDKMDCRRIDAAIRVEGPDPKPQHQYKYLLEAKEGIRSTIDKVNKLAKEAALLGPGRLWKNAESAISQINLGEVFTRRPVRTPKLWWIQGGVPLDQYRPRVNMDQYIRNMLETISEVQRQVAVNLKCDTRRSTVI